jgi:hypothetical protein
MHSEYLKVLVTGRMICAESPAAFKLFANLGSAYLGAHMPPWLCRRFGAGCLTALCKKAMVPGEMPDARPVKAEDFDCSAWTKAAQQLHTPAVMDIVKPQQLDIGVSGGVVVKNFGLKLWYEKTCRLATELWQWLSTSRTHTKRLTARRLSRR